MKKFFTICLCVVLGASCLITAFAEEKTSLVQYDVDRGYTITIPEYIIPDEVGSQDSSKYSVKMEDALLSHGETLSVSVGYSGKVAEENDVQIPYNLFAESGTINSGDEILQIKYGNTEEQTSQFGAAVTEKAKYSGLYSDTAIFNVSASRFYTLEEIEADDHLYAVGKTQPEYVIVKYNDDYTHADVLVNSEDSDGLVQSFFNGSQILGWSPLSGMKSGTSGEPLPNPHYDTLQSVTFGEGVKNVGSLFCVDSQLMNEPPTTKTISFDLGEIQTIEDAGLAFAAIDELTIPDTVTSIGQRAFMNSSASKVYVPSSVTNIGEGAFAAGTTLCGEQGSYVETWAAENGVQFEAM